MNPTRSIVFDKPENLKRSIAKQMQVNYSDDLFEIVPQPLYYKRNQAAAAIPTGFLEFFNFPVGQGTLGSGPGGVNTLWDTNIRQPNQIESGVFWIINSIQMYALAPLSVQDLQLMYGTFKANWKLSIIDKDVLEIPFELIPNGIGYSTTADDTATTPAVSTRPAWNGLAVMAEWSFEPQNLLLSPLKTFRIGLEVYQGYTPPTTFRWCMVLNGNKIRIAT